jgi:hypothetical protein
VVPFQQRAPGPIADAGRRLGRTHHVREQHGREHAIGVGSPTDAGEEPLHLVEQRIGVTGPHEVIGTG